MGQGRSPEADGGRKKSPDRRTGADTALLEEILQRLHALGWQMERLQLAEYMALFREPRRLLWINFVSGMARGLGIGIGFTVLGTAVLYILQRIMVLNLPLIGDFIAQIVYIVQNRMKVLPGI